MKTLVTLFLVLSFSFSALATSYLFPVAKLKTFTAADMKADREAKAKKQKTNLKIDEMFSAIDDTVVAITKNQLKSSPEIIRELARVTLLTFENDPGLYAAELLLPLYNKDKKSFEKALSSFSAEQRDSLLTALKDKARESVEGND
ncbi:hypothetical protein D3C87_162250 [compost metagenome]